MNTIHLEAKTKGRILATAIHGPEGKGLISGYWEPQEADTVTVKGVSSAAARLWVMRVLGNGEDKA